MQKIDFGSKVKELSISRANCADNVDGRCVLIDPSPRVKQCAWLTAVINGKEFKRSVEVNQEEAIEFKAMPRVNYYFLIARLNTDMKGNVVGSDFVVEYLQLSSSVYNDFIEACEEVGNKFTSLKLKKVIRKPGDTFGYVKPIPAQNIEIPKETIAKIKALREHKALESLWTFVDAQTSITAKQWRELVGESAQPALGNEAQSHPALENRVSTPVAEKQPVSPQASESFAKENDFESANFADDDFGGDGDFS